MAKANNTAAINALTESRRVAIDQLGVHERERETKLDRVAFLDAQIVAQKAAIASVEAGITSLGGEIEVYPPPPPAPEEAPAEAPAEAAPDA